MRSRIKTLLFIIPLCNAIAFQTSANNSDPNSVGFGLEEIVITAQKREQSLQNTPIAISVLTEKQLLQRGVTSLNDLLNNSITSLNINPYAEATSTLILSIRGNGPGDIAVPSRDQSVAVYFDEIYLGRAQGLDFELAELERIEVLRGPQGTLYGRNATAGAINLISKRPSGKFGIRQRLELGNYDLRTSSTHLDLPQWAGISSKIDYLHTERDGWVNNTAPDQSDYNAFDKQGLRLSADMSPSDNLTIRYSFNDTETEATQLYFQLYRDFGDIIGDEGGRQSRTRFPIVPLEPTKTEQQIHSLAVSWNLSDNLRFESLSAYRDLDEDRRNNYGGAAYFNGVGTRVELNQEQYSQEFRLVGDHDRLEWVAGLYHYDEKTSEIFGWTFSLDMFGILGDSLLPIIPATSTELFSGIPVPDNLIDIELESSAIYGQVTWTPPILRDRMELTIGVRHTHEDKSGNSNTAGNTESFTVPTSDQTDPTITVNYHWTENVSTYAKWSNAHRSGGIHSLTARLEPHRREKVETIEAGLKLNGFDNRLAVNTTLFSTAYDDMFVDVNNPANFLIAETINVEDIIRIKGAELELTLMPVEGLVLGLNYTYLDGDDIPPQPNPLLNNELDTFLLTQTPKHAGALTVDYTFPRFSFGTLTGHIDIFSTSAYNHWPSGGIGHPDGYYIVNARVELAEIMLAHDYGSLSFSLWGRNLADEEYITTSFSLGASGISHAFGEPRTTGIEVRYEY